MKKRILSILLCFCMALSLLPMSVLAADLTVSIGATNLTDGKYYTVKTGADPSTLVEMSDEQPAEGTPYLYFSNGIITVSGDVSITSTGLSPLAITGDKLTIDGSGSLSLISSNSPAISMSGISSMLYLSDSVNFSAKQTGSSGAPAMLSGSMEAEDGYSGNITVSSNSSSAFNSMSAIALQTTGNISITGGGSTPVISASGAVTLKGGTVSLINSNSSGSQLIVTAGENVSVTADTGDLLMSGSGSLPSLEAGSSGTGNVTLSAPNGAVSVNNTGSGVAVNGNLSANAGGNVTVESTSQRAVVGNASISADGDVAITSQGSGTYSAVVGALTVSKAKDVTVTSAGSSPTIGGATDITADGDISIKNTSSGMAVDNTLMAKSKNGSVTVEGKHSSAPTIAGITTITAAKDIRITSASESDIGKTEGNTLTAGGFVIRSNKSTGTTITKDGTPLTASYGGDVSTSGLNLSGKNNDGNPDVTYNAPAAVTLYKAGDGYALFTPATTSPAANAKLTLHGAEIKTTSGRALFLPAEPVDITVTGDNKLTANGSYNYAIDPNAQAVSITGDGNLTLNGNRGIVPWDGNTPSITINIGGALNIKTTSNPIEKVGGNLQITAKSITMGDAYGVFCNGIASFEATDGDITLTGGSGMAAVNGNAGVSLKASGKITVDNSAGSSALSSENGTVTVDAQGDVAIKAGGVAIWFGTGVAITSNADSVDVTTGGYTCIEKSSGGAGGGGVALRAATDITLNADTTAISTSAEDVCLTAGGTLSSTSKYGFQVRELTIEANEVSIEGTQQDSILATSVAITNPTGGNCKSVSVTGSGGDSYAAIRALGDATTGNITVKADDLFLCGNDNAKAISALGTVTIEGAGLIVGVISAGTQNIAAGVSHASVSGGDKSGGLNLKTPPTEATVYTAGTGYVLFTPATTTPTAPAKLTLRNATIHNTTAINDETGTGIALPNGAITLVVEGTNTVGAQYANAIWGTNTDVALSGTGILDVGYKGISLESTAANPHSVTKGANLTLNGMVKMYDNSSENGDSNTNTVYGSVSVPGDSHCTLGGTLTVAGGAALTIPQGSTLALIDAKAITNNGTIAINGTLQLPQSYNTEAAIKGLKLTGTGMVKIGSNTYTNDGVAVKEIKGDLDLSQGDHSSATVADDGYAWNDGTDTLTLGNAVVTGGLIVPDNATITTSTNSVISGSISPKGNASCALTFNGNGSLTVNGSIGNAQGGTMTVSGGAHVSVNGSVNINTSGGADGTLNVTGAGTTLNVSAPSGYAIFLETVNIGSGATVMATVEGEGSIGVEALGGGVHVTGGSTLTTGCDYGVYIEGGKLEVDSTSKLVTNGAVAPFCIVDTASSKVQDNVLSLPGTPDGTAIKSVTGTMDFSGKKHTYWSLTDGGNLNVVSASENNTPVTLTGAKTGLLTFEKASSGGDNNNGGNNSGGGGSGGGSSSVSYTLNFETNGGSKISSVSKENGSTLDLASYKPTRDGYDFAGWYANQALTDKVTSVKLTKNTTVYAKWTEKSAKPVNPFADVAEHAYYHDAVLWAVQKNVTSGTTSTAFSPDMICTRAQMVTFLWRAMGSPEPSSANCPFTDVSKDAYYNKAVLWAVEKGITAGVTETSFSPDAIVTRGQSVTFLWRAAGKPVVSSTNPYTDVSKDDFYYNAMLWAVEKGITKGTSATAFSPDGGCTRAQIVTFLYRYMGK